MSDRRGAKPTTAESVALGALAAGAVGAAAMRSRSADPAPTPAKQPSRARHVVAKAATGAGKGAKSAARATGKASAKTATALVPALSDVGNAVKHRKEIATRAKASAATAHSLMRGRKVEAAALAALTKDAGVLGNVAKNLALPALAGIAAYTTYRDAIAKNKSGGDAIIDSGVEAADVVMGGALSTYTERRGAGDSKLVAAARAAMSGLDRRFAFGIGQKAIDIQRKATREIQERQDAERRHQDAQFAESGMFGAPSQQMASSNAQSHDRTTHGIAEMGGQLPHQQQPTGNSGQLPGAAPGRGAGPQRLAAADIQKFHEANKQFSQNQQAPAQPSKDDRAKAEPKPKSDRKPGFGPEARIAAYLARHPDGENVPYGGDPTTAPDYEPPAKGQ